MRRVVIRSGVPEQICAAPNLVIRTWNPLTREERQILARNKVVDEGLSLLADLFGGTGYRPSHIELGTGTTAPVAGDTALETPEYRDEITARDKLTSALQFQLFLGLNDGNGFTYSEAGLFETGLQNDAPGDPGRLVARAIFTPVPKNNTVELTLTWTITFEAVT